MIALASIFCDRAAADTGLLDRDALASSLAAVLAAARERWPDVAFDDAAAVAALAARWAPDNASPATVEHPAFAGEVLLAEACLAGDRAAIAHVRRDMLGPARRVLARLGLASADIDDVMQDVESKLLVGSDARLARYDGRDRSLHGWQPWPGAKA